MQLASTVIYVQDVPAAMRFYADAFGFEPAFVDADVQLPGRAADDCCQFGELRLPAGTLQFATPALGALLMPGFPRDGLTRCLEVAFYTDDVAGAWGRALAAGATGLKPPARLPWGQTAAYVRAPDGTYLALCTPPAPA